MSAFHKVKVWAVAGLTALTLLQRSDLIGDRRRDAASGHQSDPHRECWHTCACEGGALEGGEGCTTRRCSVEAGHAALWYCSWGYTARLGGPPREALYTVELRGVR